MKKSLALLVIVYSIWSTSAYVVTKFKSINPLYCASIVIIISTAIFTAYILLIRKDLFSELAGLSMSDLSKMVPLSTLGLFLYPIFYFYGLHVGDPIVSNVINYFWPIIAFLFALMLRTEVLNAINLIGFCIGTIGCILVNVENRIYFAGSDNILIVSLFPVAAAISYGLYTALIKKFVLVNQQNNQLSPVLRFYIMLIISCSLHLFIILINKFDIIYELPKMDMNSIIYITIYAAFNFTVAYLLWYLVNDNVPTSYTSAFALCIPLISTFFLSFTTGKEISVQIAAGLLLIAVANILINRTAINSVNGTYISFIILILLTIIIPAKYIPNFGDNNIHSYVVILVPLFAVYYGFILSRVTTIYFNGQKKLLHLLRITLEIKHYYNINGVSEQIEILYKDVKKAYDLQISEKSFSMMIQEKANQLYDYAAQIKNIDVNLSRQLFMLANEYKEIFELKKGCVSLSEWTVLILIAITIFIMMFIGREPTVLSNAFFVIVNIAVTLCLLSLYDYNNRHI